MAETLLVDTGAWLALFDPRAEHHRAIVAVADLIDLAHLVMPWPVAYETLRTRLVRRPAWVAAFDQRLKRPSVTFIDDADYREDAYALTIGSATSGHRDLSMVDMLCRLLIEDPNVDIKYFLTVNRKDFYDVCARHRVEIWP